MIKNYPAILAAQKKQLSKALSHLVYSYQKVQSLPLEVEQLDEEMLETWESFAARFGRVVDIFLMKYLRTCVLREDPGFSGSLRDIVNQAEKLKFIENAEQWMSVRELGNVATHEYTEQDLGVLFKRLREECPLLLSLKNLLNS